jgi:hypothetical protein
MDNDRYIGIGDEVEFELILRNGCKQKLIFTIVDHKYSDVEKGFLSNHSPIAILILGEKVGSVIPYFTDETKGIEILSIRKPTHLPTITPNQRKKTMSQILNQIEYRDAILFASSVDTKWGSYDPDSMSIHNSSVDFTNPEEDEGD